MAESAADCLFCGIVRGDVPADVVREDELTLAFRDINPVAPTHVLVITREHYPNAGELAEVDPELLATLHREAAAVAADEGIDGSGYRLVYNTGPDAQQSVPHVHLHVLGGRPFTWPPG